MTMIFEKLKKIFAKPALATFVLTVAIEAITLFFRFGLGLESTKHTASTVGQFTGGIRIHHGYIGILLLLLLALPTLRKSKFCNIFLVIGASLAISDIIHHSILYLVTGSADLDLVYPDIR
ncbi:MAG: hypothetical protein AB1403_17485 [Candidatus Riflebacteria bacterium]